MCPAVTECVSEVQKQTSHTVLKHKFILYILLIVCKPPLDIRITLLHHHRLLLLLCFQAKTWVVIVQVRFLRMQQLSHQTGSHILTSVHGTDWEVMNIMRVSGIVRQENSGDTKQNSTKGEKKWTGKRNLESSSRDAKAEKELFSLNLDLPCWQKVRHTEMLTKSQRCSLKDEMLTKTDTDREPTCTLGWP